MKLTHTNRPLLALALVVAVTLFPWGWLTQQWPAFDRFMQLLFSEQIGHIIGHSVIFTLLGLCLLIALPALRRPLPYMSAILGFAIGQEFLQLIYKQRPIVADDITDLLVDLAAAALVFVIWRRISYNKQAMGDR
jgi:hypothetical protein